MDLNAHQDLLGRLAEQRAYTSNDVALLADGAQVAGECFSLTIGGLALLQHFRNPLACDSKETPTAQNALEILMVCSERWVDRVVALRGDLEEYGKLSNKFAAGFRKRQTQKIAFAMFDYMAGIHDLLPDVESASGCERHDPRWWTAIVDLIASEYGWPDEYIVWALPYVRVIEYRDRIMERLNRKPRRADFDEAELDLLNEAKERFEAERREQENTHGKT